jgi:hypothetical protein
MESLESWAVASSRLFRSDYKYEDNFFVCFEGCEKEYQKLIEKKIAVGRNIFTVIKTMGSVFTGEKRHEFYQRVVVPHIREVHLFDPSRVAQRWDDLAQKLAQQYDNNKTLQDIFVGRIKE